jgi:amino acid/amide ABC transporter substrate-binding protein, HAAT family (TC 3.A.1.4.-)
MQDEWIKRAIASRRDILGSAAGLLGSTLIPAGMVDMAFAAESYPALGTYPDGSSGDSVYVGIAVPRTGTYAQSGEDELKGMMLAIEHINDGNELIKKISPRPPRGSSARR